MNVSFPRLGRDLAVAAGALALLVPLGLRVADASPAPPEVPASGSSAAGGTAGATDAPAPDPEDAPPPPASVVAAVPASFGDRLADAAGWTLYTFSGDTWNISTCTGRCAEVWQPVRSYGGKPQPGSGIGAPLVGSLQRDDGSEQVSFGGHPLYRYSGDQQPGTAAGRDLSSFGGTWSPDAHQPALAVKP